MLLMNRQLPTWLDLLQPNMERQVVNKQANQKVTHDQHSRDWEFMIGERVMAHNLRPGPKWIPGTIVGWNGPLSYVVQVEGEQVWKRPIEQLRDVSDTPVGDILVEEPPNQNTDQPPIDEESFPITSEASGTTQHPDEQLNPSELPANRTVMNQPTSVSHHYPKRVHMHRPPKRYHN